jgi:hypothetical protein
MIYGADNENGESEEYEEEEESEEQIRKESDNLNVNFFFADHFLKAFTHLLLSWI